MIWQLFLEISVKKFLRLSLIYLALFTKKNLAFSLCHLKKEYSEKRAELLKACLYRHFVNEQEI